MVDANEPQGQDSGATDQMNLSFSGCGFLGIYHVGVASAIKEYMPHALQHSNMAGCSAGALVAAALMCDCCLGQATTDTLKLVIQARSTPLGPLRPTFQLMQTVRAGLEAMLPANAHAICDKRLYISLTRFSDGTNVLVNRYSNNNELIQALICSAFIPFYCGTVPPTFRGVRYMDGGLSLNQPELPALDMHGNVQRTVVVSPWSGESDICPPDEDSGSWLGMTMSNTSFRFTARNLYRATVALFPPHPEVMSRMCQQGFEDALRYMAKNGLVNCARCLAVRSCINVPVEVEEPAQAESPGQFYVPAEPVTVPAPVPATTTPIVKTESSSHTAGPSTRGLKRMPAVTLSNRKRAVTTGNLQLLRHHLYSDSECDSCREMINHEHGPPTLPRIVSTKLAEAQAPQSGLLNYVWSLRAVRFMKYLALPYMLPIEFVYTVAVKLLNWLPTIADDARWFVERTTMGIRMLLSALEQHRHQYSARFSCQLAVTEMNYNSVGAVPAQSVLRSTYASAVCLQSLDRVTHNNGNSVPGHSHNVLGSVSSLHSAPTIHSQPSTYYDECEAHFAISADLHAEDKHDPLTRHLSRYVSQRHRNDDNQEMVDAAVNLQWAALNQSAHSSNQSSLTPAQTQPISDKQQMEQAQEVDVDEDRDTVHAIVEYTRKHDSLMAYYYMDEQGQMTWTEIYGVDKHSHAHEAGHEQNSCNQHELPSLIHKHSTQHRPSHPNIHLAPSNQRRGSLRLSNQHQLRHRSPTNQLAANTTTNTDNRRSASFEEPVLGKVQTGNEPVPVCNVTEQHLQIVNESNSDDSEEGEDRLFVPRRARHTGGYEADTDQG